MSSASGHFSPPHRNSHTSSVSGPNRQNSQQSANSANYLNSSPFISPAPNANSKFLPSKMGTNKGSTANDYNTTPLKPPKRPDKPLTPYMRYSRKMWDKVRAAHPDSKLWDIGKVVGSMWRELPEHAKQVYFDEYELEKVEYEKAYKAYKHSPAYAAYEQQQRNKARAEKGNRSAANSETGIYIQPVDEDDGGEENLTAAHIAGARFERNQKLMLEIFNSTAVPDPRNVINSHRMIVLKRQVRSLTSHQKKLEDELEQLEAKFQEKKRHLSESSQLFTEKLKKVCEEAPVIDDAQFEAMVLKHEQKMLQAYADYKRRQTELSLAEENNVSKIVASLLQELKDKISENLSREASYAFDKDYNSSLIATKRADASDTHCKKSDGKIADEAMDTSECASPTPSINMTRK